MKKAILLLTALAAFASFGDTITNWVYVVSNVYYNVYRTQYITNNVKNTHYNYYYTNYLQDVVYRSEYNSTTNVTVNVTTNKTENYDASQSAVASAQSAASSAQGYASSASSSASSAQSAANLAADSSSSASGYANRAGSSANTASGYVVQCQNWYNKMLADRWLQYNYSDDDISISGDFNAINNVATNFSLSFNQCTINATNLVVNGSNSELIVNSKEYVSFGNEYDVKLRMDTQSGSSTYGFMKINTLTSKQKYVESEGKIYYYIKGDDYIGDTVSSWSNGEPATGSMFYHDITTTNRYSKGKLNIVTGGTVVRSTDVSYDRYVLPTSFLQENFNYCHFLGLGSIPLSEYVDYRLNAMSNWVENTFQKK